MGKISDLQHKEAKLKRDYFLKDLTLRSKIIHIYRKIKKFILDFELFYLTGVFVGIILLLYMKWYEAFIIGVFGYLIFLRLEFSLMKIFRKK